MSITESMNKLLGSLDEVKLSGIDPSNAKEAFSYWKDGKEFYFSQTFKNGDTIWFKPSSRLKNGNLKGKMTELYGSKPSKPKQMSMHKLDASMWKFHEPREVPSKVLAKLG